MFEDLINFTPEPTTAEGFVDIEAAPVKDIIKSQVQTSDWLEQMGAKSDADVIAPHERAAARDAFKSVTFDMDISKQRAALASVKTPDAVLHLTGMLTAYDWEFVHHAKELRNYAVSKILEETNNPNANVRLKALQMLGNVTEVALFTERVEVTKKDASEEELESRLRERLARFMKKPVPVEVVDVIELNAPVKNA
jgi:hypothetical protein